MVEARVARVERRLDDHLSAMASKREIMDIAVRQLTVVMAKQNKKLDALCRASARPQVCLGED